MKKIAIALIALFVGATGALGADLSMVYSNAINDSLPFEIFTKNKWSPDQDARFVKLHLYIDEPILISGVEINSCGKPLSPDITTFINFDQWILNYAEYQGELPGVFDVEETNDSIRLVTSGEPFEARSLTINFESNKGFSICGIKILDPTKANYVLNVPRIVDGVVEASSTATPKVDFDVMNLFDSRFEHAWISGDDQDAAALNFKFASTQRIEKIRIWNGDQLSAVHCQSNGRIKKLLVTGDNNYSQQVALEDKLGPQTVYLPIAYEGRSLRLAVIETYPGNVYKGVAISELRFNDGEAWFMLDPLKKITSDIAVNRGKFRRANLEVLLNDGYASTDNMDIGSGQLKLRLRADGSFYFSGWSDNEDEGMSRKYFALGGYEVVSSSNLLGLKLSVNGLLRTVYTELGGAEYGDCNGCGRDCNSADDAGGYEVFKGYMYIKKDENNIITLTNQSGNRLPFRDIRISRENRSPVRIKPRMTPDVEIKEAKPVENRPLGEAGHVKPGASVHGQVSSIK